jgi:hypothetical protein
MAKIITLGLEVADVHRRYSAVHGSLFGASSFRLVIDALRGRGHEGYVNSHRTLVALLDLLQGLEQGIEACEPLGKTTRGTQDLQRVLLDYCAALAQVIAGLAGICHNLAQDEPGYRQIDAGGRSRFSRDKVNYDYALGDLEKLGNKLNRLFAAY